MPTVSPLRDLSPNWFTSVMGTGIVANAAVLLPVSVPGLRALALAVWIAAALLLAGLATLTVVQGCRDVGRLRRHLGDPAMAPFFGAPAMALLTVGAGALLVGRDAIGLAAALDVAAVLWVTGTLMGLCVFVVVPVTLLRAGRSPGRPPLTLRDAQATWLLPVVPPMVSAATGAGLIGHLPSGDARLALLAACYLLFALSLGASAAMIALFVTRLRRHGLPQARMIPTLWIVLGPLGQSITAVTLLGAAATSAGLPHAAALRTFAAAYGIPVLVLALTWLATAATITLRTARDQLPFSLTWWSFTFPVGTCATGASELALRTGTAAFTPVALVLFTLLLTAWATVATRTTRGLRRPGRRRAPAAMTPVDA
jgi:tellurite resistance protein TehA-like permease